jgi:hypothetical protein
VCLTVARGCKPVDFAFESYDIDLFKKNLPMPSAEASSTKAGTSPSSSKAQNQHLKIPQARNSEGI